MGCATGIVKTLVFIFNLACTIVGAILIGIGSLYYVLVDEIDEITHGNFKVAQSIVIAVGVVVFLISFLGCCGVCQKSSCMLILYAVILLILLIVQIVAGVYGFIQIKDNKDFETNFKTELTKSIKLYPNDAEIRKVFDSLQQQFECCGVTGRGDYDEGAPKSCESKDGKKYNEGCYQKLSDQVKSSIKIVSYVAIGIAAVEFLGALFAIFLVNSIKNESRRGFA